MSNDFKCIVCKGKHFRKGKYEIDTNVDIYSTISNDVKGSEERIDVDSRIYHETDVSTDLEFNLEDTDKKYYDTCEVYNYSCEDCGFVMSFTKEKNVVSHEEERKQKEKERTYDWTNFK